MGTQAERQKTYRQRTADADKPHFNNTAKSFAFTEWGPRDPCRFYVLNGCLFRYGGGSQNDDFERGYATTSGVPLLGEEGNHVHEDAGEDQPAS